MLDLGKILSNRRHGVTNIKQYYGCCWFGGTRSPGIANHEIDAMCSIKSTPTRKKDICYKQMTTNVCLSTYKLTK